MTQEIEGLRVQVNQMRMRFRTLMEAIPVGILILGEDGVVENANPHALALFKSTDYDYLIDKRMTDLFSGEKRVDLTNENIYSQGTDAPIEVSAILPNDERLPAEILIKPFVDEQAQKVLVAVEDVSKRHELEELKRQFVSMVTHDLRSPLTAVKIFLGMTVEGVFDNQMEKLKLRATNTEREVDRMIKLINNLLDLDKMEAGRLQLNIESVQISDLIDSAIASLAALSDQRGVPIKVSDQCGDLSIQADSDYIVQVLVNLLSNALKFSPSGQAVELALEQQECLVKIMVSDKGPGIPFELKTRLFDRFAQAQPSDRKVKGGSGLGLAISKNIIEEHGGTIGVESEEGFGTTFWFTLPLAPSVQA